MPIPRPGRDESHDDFMDRCMGDSVMTDEYPEGDQRAAVCQRAWDARGASAGVDGAKVVSLRIERDTEFDGFGGKTIKLTGTLSAKAASPGDLEIINSYAVKTLTEDEVAIYEGNVANSRIDRDGERFNEDVLADFADSLPGKSLLVGHNWAGPGVGRFFKAWLVEDDGAMWLRGAFYLLKKDPDAQALITKIDGGVAWALSVGFSCPDRMVMTGRDGSILYAEYRRGPNGERAEAMEASLVFLGAQFDAQIARKAAMEMAQHVRKHAGRTRQMHPDQKKSLVAKFGELIDGLFGAAPVPAPEGAKAVVPDGGDGPVKKERRPCASRTKAGTKGKKDEGMTPDGTPCSCDPDADDYDPECECGMAAKEGDEMDPKVIEQLQAGLKAVAEAVEGLKAEVAGLLGWKTQTEETIGKLAKDADEFGEAGEKIFDRLEAVEAVLSTPKSAKGDEGGAGDGNGDGKKGRKGVFGNMILPSEFHRR
jgi:hypothetical protein